MPAVVVGPQLSALGKHIAGVTLAQMYMRATVIIWKFIALEKKYLTDPEPSRFHPFCA